MYILEVPIITDDCGLHEEYFEKFIERGNFIGFCLHGQCHKLGRFSLAWW